MTALAYGHPRRAKPRGKNLFNHLVSIHLSTIPQQRSQ
jgi:hypothetical protein